MDIVKHSRLLVASFESLADHKKISLDFNSYEEEMLCYLDPEMVNTILSNLLSNAFKFTSKGGLINISISGCNGNKHEKCSQKEGCVFISVKDNGTGIPEDKLPFIFDRYYRVDKSPDKQRMGTGLGLTLVRELVHLHEGTIDVQSEEDKFTEFVIRFPVNHYHLKTEDIFETEELDIDEDFQVLPVHADLSQNESKSEVSKLDQKIILIIEDNPDMREVIRSGIS